MYTNLCEEKFKNHNGGKKTKRKHMSKQKGKNKTKRKYILKNKRKIYK